MDTRVSLGDQGDTYWCVGTRGIYQMGSFRAYWDCGPLFPSNCNKLKTSAGIVCSAQ